MRLFGDWTTNVRTTHYVIGKQFLRPHPFPVMVRHFQSVIGRETKRQILTAEGRLPDYLIACVGVEAMPWGCFMLFLLDSVEMVGG